EGEVAERDRPRRKQVQQSGTRVSHQVGPCIREARMVEWHSNRPAAKTKLIGAAPTMADSTLRIYPEADIAGRLAELGLTKWYLEDGWLRRKYTTAGWQTTLMLVNVIGYYAEAAWHHPDLTIT